MSEAGAREGEGYVRIAGRERVGCDRPEDRRRVDGDARDAHGVADAHDPVVALERI